MAFHEACPTCPALILCKNRNGKLEITSEPILQENPFKEMVDPFMAIHKSEIDALPEGKINIQIGDSFVSGEKRGTTFHGTAVKLTEYNTDIPSIYSELSNTQEPPQRLSNERQYDSVPEQVNSSSPSVFSEPVKSFRESFPVRHDSQETPFQQKINNTIPKEIRATPKKDEQEYQPMNKPSSTEIKPDREIHAAEQPLYGKPSSTAEHYLSDEPIKQRTHMSEEIQQHPVIDSYLQTGSTQPVEYLTRPTREPSFESSSNTKVLEQQMSSESFSPESYQEDRDLVGSLDAEKTESSVTATSQDIPPQQSQDTEQFDDIFDSFMNVSSSEEQHIQSSQEQVVDMHIPIQEKMAYPTQRLEQKTELQTMLTTHKQAREHLMKFLYSISEKDQQNLHHDEEVQEAFMEEESSEHQENKIVLIDLSEIPHQVVRQFLIAADAKTVGIKGEVYLRETTTIHKEYFSIYDKGKEQKIILISDDTNHVTLHIPERSSHFIVKRLVTYLEDIHYEDELTPEENGNLDKHQPLLTGYNVIGLLLISYINELVQDIPFPMPIRPYLPQFLTYPQ